MIVSRDGRDPAPSRVKAGRTAQRQVGLQDRVEAEAGPDQQIDQRPTGAAHAAEPGAPGHPRAPTIGPVIVGPEPVAQRLVPLVPSPAIGRSREAKLLRNSHREQRNGCFLTGAVAAITAPPLLNIRKASEAVCPKPLRRINSGSQVFNVYSNAEALINPSIKVGNQFGAEEPREPRCSAE